METTRAFIAINLSSEIHHNLEQVIRELRENMDRIPIRWIPVKNIHLTIKFLGEVSATNLSTITEILQSVAINHSCFEIRVGELGAFPSIHRPRVIWVGVEAPSELKSLHKDIEIETASLGYEPENRPFSPHLTLGRASKNIKPSDHRRISEVLGQSRIGFFGNMLVRSIYLYRSDLQPGGAIYTQLFSTELVETDH